MRLQDKVIVVTGANQWDWKRNCQGISRRRCLHCSCGRNSTAGLKVEEQICRDGGNAFFRGNRYSLRGHV